MTTMTARYPGTCATSGQPIRPGDLITLDPVTRRASLAAPAAHRVDPADTLDAYMPRHGLGRTRAQVWRQSQNARYGAGLDHESE
jgi:hypothetical protein